MGGLRVLITNNTLTSRAGSELYVRDTAAELLKRGHAHIAYSTVPGEAASELQALKIPVVDDLNKLAVAPDLIHGQQHLELMTALHSFPACRLSSSFTTRAVGMKSLSSFRVSSLLCSENDRCACWSEPRANDRVVWQSTTVKPSG